MRTRMLLCIEHSIFIFSRKRLVKQRQRHKTECNDTMMFTSSSVRFNRHHQHKNDHHHQNWTVSLLMTSNKAYVVLAYHLKGV